MSYSVLDLNYPKIAADLIAETKHIERLNRILPDVHRIINRKTNVSEMFDRFKNQYVRFLQASIKLEQARNAASDAVKQLVQPDKSFLVASRQMAVTKFNIGACGELATYVASKLMEKGISSYILVVSGSDNNHGFNLLGVSQSTGDFLDKFESKGGMSLSEFFKKVKSGYLIDSYLECHGPVENFENSLIAKYNIQMNLDQLEYVLPNKGDKEHAKRIFGESEEIFEKAKALFSVESLSESMQLCAHLLLQKQKIIAERIFLRFGEVCSSMEWKRSFKNYTLTLWTRGEKEPLDQVKQKLVSLGYDPVLQRIVDQDEYCLKLVDPYPHTDLDKSLVS